MQSSEESVHAKSCKEGQGRDGRLGVLSKGWGMVVDGR